MLDKIAEHLCKEIKIPDKVIKDILLGRTNLTPHNLYTAYKLELSDLEIKYGLPSGFYYEVIVNFNTMLYYNHMESKILSNIDTLTEKLKELPHSGKIVGALNQKLPLLIHSLLIHKLEKEKGNSV